MPTLTISYRDEAERLGIEQALAFFTQLRQAAQDAPHGTVLDACEQVALNQGRALLRDCLAAAVQARADAAELKGGPLAPPPARAGTAATPRGGTAAPPSPPSGRLTWPAVISPAPPAVKATSAPTPYSAWTAT